MNYTYNQATRSIHLDRALGTDEVATVRVTTGWTRDNVPAPIKSVILAIVERQWRSNEVNLAKLPNDVAPSDPLNLTEGEKLTINPWKDGTAAI